MNAVIKKVVKILAMIIATIIAIKKTNQGKVNASEN